MSKNEHSEKLYIVVVVVMEGDDHIRGAGENCRYKREVETICTLRDTKDTNVTDLALIFLCKFTDYYHPVVMSLWLFKNEIFLQIKCLLARKTMIK